MRDFTRVFVKAHDAERRILGPEGDLDVIKHVLSTGYRSIETITSGWTAERTTEHATGTEFFEVKIAETDADLEALFKGRPSHLKIGDLCYKIEGVQEPKQATDVWVIRCSLTGEKLDVGSFLIAQTGNQLITQAGGLLRAHG